MVSCTGIVGIVAVDKDREDTPVVGDTCSFCTTCVGDKRSRVMPGDCNQDAARMLPDNKRANMLPMESIHKRRIIAGRLLSGDVIRFISLLSIQYLHFSPLSTKSSFCFLFVLSVWVRL
jgi:hypothetical protein